MLRAPTLEHMRLNTLCLSRRTSSPHRNNCARQAMSMRVRSADDIVDVSTCAHAYVAVYRVRVLVTAPAALAGRVRIASGWVAALAPCLVPAADCQSSMSQPSCKFNCMRNVLGYALNTLWINLGCRRGRRWCEHHSCAQQRGQMHVLRLRGNRTRAACVRPWTSAGARGAPACSQREQLALSKHLLLCKVQIGLHFFEKSVAH